MLITGRTIFVFALRRLIFVICDSATAPSKPEEYKSVRGFPVYRLFRFPIDQCKLFMGGVNIFSTF